MTTNEIEIGDTVRVVVGELAGDEFIVDAIDTKSYYSIAASYVVWFKPHELEIMESKADRVAREKREKEDLEEAMDARAKEMDTAALCYELCKRFNDNEDMDRGDLEHEVYKIFKED